MVLPVIERVAPQLSCSRERIRRTPCHSGRVVVLIELKEFRRSPCICTVERDVDRDISDDLDALRIGICVELLPLSVKLILLETIEINLFGKLLPCLRKSSLISVAQRSFPLFPAHTVIPVFDRHIKGIILKPVIIFVYKASKFFIFFKTVIRFLQHFKT